MGMTDWVITVVVAAFVIVGIVFVAAASNGASSDTDTFGNAHTNQTNTTIQTAQSVGQGTAGIGSGVIIFLAIICLIGIPLGLIFFRQPRW